MPINILVVTNTFRPHVGGVAKSVEAFVREYRSRGHGVLVVAPEFEGAPANEAGVVRVEAVQKFNGSDFSVPMPVPKFLDLVLDDFEEQIVHSHHPFLLGDTALRVAAWQNAPLVFTHHTLYDQYTHYVPGDSPTMKRFVIELVTGYCNLCEAVVAPSASVERLLRERGVESRIEVIPTGVDVARYSQGDRARGRRALGLDGEAFVVGHVGRLAPEKNLAFLADAAAEYLARNDRAVFLVVGSGPSSPEIKATFQKRGLAERLKLVGTKQAQDLVDAYHAMDVFIFASQSETQGMVLTEAMAAGCPVVAVDASGVRDVMVDQENGRMLERQSVDSFVEAIAWVRDLDDASRKRMRQSLAETAERFSIARCADRMLALYFDLLDDERRTRDLEDNPWLTAARFFQQEWNLRANQARAVGEAIRGAAQAAGELE